jgi:hypothetical protein
MGPSFLRASAYPDLAFCTNVGMTSASVWRLGRRVGVLC